MNQHHAADITQSVDLIANIVGKKLAITGQEARRMAMTGSLSGVTQAFYSRQPSPSKTKQS
ncbi:hypothetical protein AXW37_06300 [Yersinia ruckeri]|uniref:hypothetical protein n=1 Tax=Yersinia ruckeri TaxID=29486 RepID=UPI0004E3D4FF|nr:hypothetical protein [Yersinia ruckeri]ARZ00512.1 hypothetical protein QMA0440_01168 [Yersinia ruckeri]EKN4689041.1 hypothetical protein [Yersinia ruckeri]KFE38107.1 porin [Yersinia ruckeri]MCK8585278.1 hypothetical protein [Yersinia ruckeri]MCW6524267.1 hypothetical protein [Yersinia ruckeri]